MSNELAVMEKKLVEGGQALEAVANMAAAAGDSPIDMTGDQLFFLLQLILAKLTG